VPISLPKTGDRTRLVVPLSTTLGIPPLYTPLSPWVYHRCTHLFHPWVYHRCTPREATHPVHTHPGRLHTLYIHPGRLVHPVMSTREASTPCYTYQGGIYTRLYTREAYIHQGIPYRRAPRVP